MKWINLILYATGMSACLLWTAMMIVQNPCIDFGIEYYIELPLMIIGAIGLFILSINEIIIGIKEVKNNGKF